MAEQWKERDDFPVVCAACLGSNTHVRMIKLNMNDACKICKRPFTVYRWKGSKGKSHKTCVCSTCAKVRNVCQSCILDLEFGLPIHVRDAGLAMMERTAAVAAGGGAAGAATVGDAGGGGGGGGGALSLQLSENSAQREWQLEAAERDFAASGGNEWSRDGVANVVGAYMRAAPYYAPNLRTVCAFWLRGVCTRGTACPHLHERVTQQNAASRATVQPVAEAAVGGVRSAQGVSELPALPADTSLKTIFVGGLHNAAVANEAALRAHFAACGEIASVRVVPAKSVAFVEFATRGAAETAVQTMHHASAIGGTRIHVNWANAPATSQHRQGSSQSGNSNSRAANAPERNDATASAQQGAAGDADDVDIADAADGAAVGRGDGDDDGDDGDDDDEGAAGGASDGRAAHDVSSAPAVAATTTTAAAKAAPAATAAAATASAATPYASLGAAAVDSW